jgi:hypothetical protein
MEPLQIGPGNKNVEFLKHVCLRRISPQTKLQRWHVQGENGMHTVVPNYFATRKRQIEYDLLSTVICRRRIEFVFKAMESRKLYVRNRLYRSVGFHCPSVFSNQ